VSQLFVYKKIFHFVIERLVAGKKGQSEHRLTDGQWNQLSLSWAVGHRYAIIT
jgi:hypothetical protein